LLFLEDRVMGLAAEQPSMVAPRASPGNPANNKLKQRSCCGRTLACKINVAAPQLLCPMAHMTCGFTAGYLPPLLRSESQKDRQSIQVRTTVLDDFDCHRSTTSFKQKRRDFERGDIYFTGNN